MKKLIRIKTDCILHGDVLQHPYLKRLGAYNPLLGTGNYDISRSGDRPKFMYGIHRYMPIHTRIPIAGSIYTKWNPIRGKFDILILSAAKSR